MLLRNEAEDFNKFLYVNGTIAKVVALADKIVDVEIPGRGVHRIEFAEWDSIKYDMLDKTLTHRVSGSFSQIPMKLAAAFSIHKSQSKTFDKVHINMGKGAFDYGQAYVGLSRCRTLEGMSLEKPLARRDVMVDPRITEYFRAAKEAGLVTEVSQAFDERLA